MILAHKRNLEVAGIAARRSSVDESTTGMGTQINNAEKLKTRSRTRIL